MLATFGGSSDPLVGFTHNNHNHVSEKNYVNIQVIVISMLFVSGCISVKKMKPKAC